MLEGKTVTGVVYAEAVRHLAFKNRFRGRIGSMLSRQALSGSIVPGLAQKYQEWRKYTLKSNQFDTEMSRAFK